MPAAVVPKSVGARCWRLKRLGVGRSKPWSGSLKTLTFLVTQHEQVKALHLLARPWRFAQKLQAGAQAGIVREAAYGDALAQIVPAIKVSQTGDDGLERESVQWVARLGLACSGRGFGLRFGWRWLWGGVDVLHGLIVDAKQTFPNVPGWKCKACLLRDGVRASAKWR